MFPLLPLRIPVDCDFCMQLSNWIDARHHHHHHHHHPHAEPQHDDHDHDHADQHQQHQQEQHRRSDDRNGGGGREEKAAAAAWVLQLLPPTVAECQADLQRLENVRRNVARVMQEKLMSSSSSSSRHHPDGGAGGGGTTTNSTDSSLSSLTPKKSSSSSSSLSSQDVLVLVELLKDYAVHLEAFCDASRGFPVTEEQGKIINHNNRQQQQQQQQLLLLQQDNDTTTGPPLSPPVLMLDFPWKIISNSSNNDENNCLDSSSSSSSSSSSNHYCHDNNYTSSLNHSNHNHNNSLNGNSKQDNHTTTAGTTTTIKTEITTITTTTTTTGSSLTWERANVYWNLAALAVLQAKSLHPATTKPAWSEMGTLLQTAACWIQHLRCHVVLKQQQHQQQPPLTSAKAKQHDHGDGDDDDTNNKNKNPSLANVFQQDTDAWLSPRVLLVLESFLAAASQCAAFEWFQLSKSQHLMSAKLAAASIPFYAMAEEEAHAAVQALQHELILWQNHQHLNHQQHLMAKPNATTAIVTGVLQQWANALRAWGMWMSAVSEYHQALVHENKRKTAADAAAAGKPPSSCSVQQRRQQLAQQEEHLSLELARLDIANRFGTLCQENLNDYCSSMTPASPAQPSPSLESRFLLGTLVKQVQVVLPQIRAQQLHAQQEEQRFTVEYNNSRALVIPSHEELPEIPPQTQVKLNSEPSAMAKLLPPRPNDLFKTTLNEQARRILLDTRLDWEEEWLPALEQEAEEVTEEGRRTLRSVNLPRSLTLYRQERSGGGIPQDLWLRVEQLQQENRITRLQQELWDLKDVADQASVLYKGIHSQLQDDLTMDQLYREHNPTFEGHDVEEIQKTFRLTLENYAHLMESAEKGDALLFKRLELLNTDPKYRLLQFRKSQLDRLIPPNNSMTTTTQQDVNVEELSRYLVELSALFQQRDDLLDAIKKQMRTTHASCVSRMIQTMQEQQQQQQQQQQQDDEVYRDIVASARRSLEQGMVQGLRDNMNAQSDLLEHILEENEYFCRARGGTSAAAAAMPASPSNNTGDRSISKIEDALEEMDQLDKHLKEGRAFYNVVIPKLEKLQQQVGDVSARLTIDRCDFDDKARRKHQEAEDARMAASMSSSSDNSSNNNINTNSSPTGGSSQNPPPFCREPSTAARSPSNEQHHHHHHHPMRQSSNSSSNFDSGGSSSSGSGHGGHGSTGGGGVGPMPMSYQRHHQMQQSSNSSSNFDSGGSSSGSGQSRHGTSGAGAGGDGVEPVPMSSPLAPNHGQPAAAGFRVDDEKVASLVAMDFDPDKVVAALKKYDNNLDQAINDLLSSG